MSNRETARRFHFLREIASGGFGCVYLCKVVHPDGFSRLAAVKLLKSQWSDNEEVVQRIRDEARLLGLLRHRNIVDVIDLTSIDGRTAVVMEYLEAVDFRMIIKESPAMGWQVPLKAALEVAAAVASALDAAYNRPPISGEKPLRVIHRDIKPSNLMVDANGMIKVLDFGVARSEFEGRESHTRELQFGSVDYMAPERLFFEPETPASDIYSLSVTIFEILAREKFGKARGSPDRHAGHVADRLSFLRAKLGLVGIVALELEALLKIGLAFEHEKRPNAAAFQQRARALSRLVDGADLISWSEREIPELVRKAQSTHRKGSPLSDSILAEDSLAFANPDEEEASSRPIWFGDGLADEVRRGALAELQSPASFVPSPMSGVPLQSEDQEVLLPIEEPAAIGDEEEFEPTVAFSYTSLPPDPAEVLGQAKTIVPRQPERSLIAPRDSSEPVLTEFTRMGPPGTPHRDPPPEEPKPPPQSLSNAETVMLPVDQLQPPRNEKPVVIQESVRPRVSAAVKESGPTQRRTQGKWVKFVAMAAGCLMPVLLVAVCVFIVRMDVGGIQGKLQSPSSVPISSPGPEVDVRAPATGDADGASGEGILFQSADSETVKIRVQCDSISEGGERDVRVSLADAQSCMVTIHLTDRNRRTTVVQNASTGVYTCFEDEEAACVRQ